MGLKDHHEDKSGWDLNCFCPHSFVVNDITQWVQWSKHGKKRSVVSIQFRGWETAKIFCQKYKTLKVHFSKWQSGTVFFKKCAHKKNNGGTKYQICDNAKSTFHEMEQRQSKIIEFNSLRQLSCSFLNLNPIHNFSRLQNRISKVHGA